MAEKQIAYIGVDVPVSKTLTACGAVEVYRLTCGRELNNKNGKVMVGLSEVAWVRMS